jgi:hypothetical protein
MSNKNNLNNDELVNAAITVPAVLADRFVVTLTDAGCRIAFAEQTMPESLPIFRNAVILSYPNALELYKLLQGMLKDVEQSLNTNDAAPKSDLN